MVYAPQTQSGSFFNDQEREVASLQWVEALSLSRDWHGQHVFKLGTDLQRSQFDGFSASRPVEIRRLDGSLAELTVFGDRTEQEVSGFEFAVFAQDRWRLGSRVTFELGLRLDRDAIVERVNWSPRAGVAIGVAPEGRAILRGGFGKFVQRTPLNVEAFPSFEPRTVSRFAPGRRAAWPAHRPSPTSSMPTCALRKPTSATSNGTSASAGGCCSSWSSCGASGIARVHRDARRRRARAAAVDSTGTSRYRELEATTRYLGGERRDITVSYVWAKGTADLNNYDQFFGNLRNPIIRSQREQPDSDRRPASAAAARHARAAGQVGFRAGAGAAIRVPMVGGGRVPGFRGSAQPQRAPARGSHARLHARAAVAVQEVPLPRRPQALQRLRRVGGHGTCRTT